MKFVKSIKVLTVLALFLVVASGLSISARAASGAVRATTVQSVEDLQQKINSNIAKSSEATITTSWSGKSGVYKVTAPSDGWILIRSYSSYERYGKCYLYSNAALMNRLDKSYCGPNTVDNLIAVYVGKGDYYYQYERWNGTGPITFSSYVGFIPASSRLSVAKVVYSKDKTSATVNFRYDSKYFEGFLTDSLRVVKQDVVAENLKNDKVWQTQDRANALTKNAFTATANGVYTARITTNDGYWVTVKFKISGLSVKKPKKPTVTASSVKKNSKKIKGKATPHTTVIVKVKKKTYTATAKANGAYTVKLKSKLKKGTKIKIYSKNAAGMKSKTRKITVK